MFVWLNMGKTSSLGSLNCYDITKEFSISISMFIMEMASRKPSIQLTEL